VLEQPAQRSYGCPIPGGVQGQVGWGPGQPELIPMAGDWNWKVFKIPSNPT